MDIEARQIWETNEAGRLTGAGFTWPVFDRDKVKSAHVGMNVALVGAAFAGLFGVILFLFPPVRQVATVLLCIAAVGGALFAVMRGRMRGARPYMAEKTVIFRTDGQVMMRDRDGEELYAAKLIHKGIRETTKTPLRVEQVASIEVGEDANPWRGKVGDGPYFLGEEQTYLLNYVFLNLTTGQKVRVYDSLPSRDDAAIARENLDRALYEVRRNMPRATRG